MNGCTESCPCSRWINCSRYNNWKWEQHNNKEYEELNKWYDTKFRLTSYYPDGFGNG